MFLKQLAATVKEANRTKLFDKLEILYHLKEKKSAKKKIFDNLRFHAYFLKPLATAAWEVSRTNLWNKLWYYPLNIKLFVLKTYYFVHNEENKNVEVSYPIDLQYKYYITLWRKNIPNHLRFPTVYQTEPVSHSAQLQQKGKWKYYTFNHLQNAILYTMSPFDGWVAIGTLRWNVWERRQAGNISSIALKVFMKGNTESIKSERKRKILKPYYSNRLSS